MSDLLHKLLWEPNLLDPGRKPNELVEVDWSLSITRGLKFDTLLDGNPDIVGGKEFTLNGDATWQVSRGGKCLNCTLSDDWAGTPDHPDFEVANNNNGFTWIFIADLRNLATNTDRSLIGRESEVSGNRSIRISKKKNNIDEFAFATADINGNWGVSTYTFPIGITYDKPYFLAGKVDDRSGSPVKNLFLDGQKSSDMDNAFNEYADYAQEWRIGIGQTSNDYVGNIYRAIFFNRPLEDEEIERIRRNPNLYLLPSSSQGVPTAVAAVEQAALTGNAGTGAEGNLAPSVSVALTGNQGIGNVGTLVPSAGINIVITGNQGTGAEGSLAPSMSLPLTGEEGTGAEGSLAFSISVPLTGEEGTGNEGTLSSALSINLSGVQGTGTEGDLAPSINVSLTGEEATGAIGTLVPSVGVFIALTGEQGTGSEGTLTGAISVPLSGEEGVGAIGILTPTVGEEAPLTGEEGTGNIGALAPAISVTLSGNEGTGSEGSLVSSVSVALSGEEATGDVGTLVPSGGAAFQSAWASRSNQLIG
jgi:hypothetical protein